MTDWKANKGLGPWAFTPQPNKWGYLNNPNWVNDGVAPISYDGVESTEPQVWSIVPTNNVRTSGDQVIHNPCGHWHKPVTIVPVALEDVFNICGAPTVAAPDERDYCYKRTNDLDFIIRYGGYGSGLDQLKCPHGVTVDDTYVYISDVNNGRVMKRLRSDLTYVHHIAINYLRLLCVHTDGVQLWSGGAYGIDELNITTLTTIRNSLTTPPPAKINTAYDITCDADYLYVCDANINRIVKLNKSDMSFVAEYGTQKSYALSPIGNWTDGTNLFISDWAANKILKIRLTDWELLASAGHRNLGTAPLYYRQPQGVFGYGTYLFVCDNTAGKIRVINQSDLSYVTQFSTENYSTFGLYIDNDYIYSAEWDFLSIYDRSTYALANTVETFNKILGVCGDATHVYVTDAADNIVYKIQKSDLSTSASYTDAGHATIGDMTYCAVDDNYVYVGDQGNDVIHRLDKSDMSYVDSFGSGSLANPQQMSISGGLLYVTNYLTNARAVVVFNLGTLAVADSAPEFSTDSDLWITAPIGIACDADKIYIGNRVSTVGVGGGEVSDLIILNRADLSFVSRIPLAYTRVEHIAVDDTYLYIAFWSVTDGQSYVKKYNKSTLAEVDTQPDYKQYVISVDTWYPWYK